MIKHNPKWIYLLKVYEADGPTYKIGYTKNDPKKRTPQLQTGNKNEIEIKHVFWSEYSTRLEANLHKFYSHYRQRGEWFNLPPEVVKNFISICEKQESNLKLLAESNMYLQDLNQRKES